MTVEENPEFYCCYYNEEDERSCICWAYDRACCNKPRCMPNLATRAGKIILATWVVVVVTVILAPLLFF